MSFHVPELSRDTTHPQLGTTSENGNNGAFDLESPEPGWRVIDEETSFSIGVRFYFDGEPPKGRVWGAVKLWGRIIEHEIGYRAEFAYPSALFCEDEKLAAVVSRLYGVPCEVLKLERPAMSLEMSWVSLNGNYIAPIYYAPFHVQAFPYPTQPPAPAPPTSLAQVKAIGATSYQRKAETQRAANKAAAEAKKRDLIAKYLGKKSDPVEA